MTYSKFLDEDIIFTFNNIAIPATKTYQYTVSLNSTVIFYGSVFIESGPSRTVNIDITDIARNYPYIDGQMLGTTEIVSSEEISSTIYRSYNVTINISSSYNPGIGITVIPIYRYPHKFIDDLELFTKYGSNASTPLLSGTKFTSYYKWENMLTPHYPFVKTDNYAFDFIGSNANTTAYLKGKIEGKLAGFEENLFGSTGLRYAVRYKKKLSTLLDNVTINNNQQQYTYDLWGTLAVPSYNVGGYMQDNYQYLIYNGLTNGSWYYDVCDIDDNILTSYMGVFVVFENTFTNTIYSNQNAHHINFYINGTKIMIIQLASIFNIPGLMFGFSITGKFMRDGQLGNTIVISKFRMMLTSNYIIETIPASFTNSYFKLDHCTGSDINISSDWSRVTWYNVDFTSDDTTLTYYIDNDGTSIRYKTNIYWDNRNGIENQRYGFGVRGNEWQNVRIEMYTGELGEVVYTNATGQLPFIQDENKFWLLDTYYTPSGSKTAGQINVHNKMCGFTWHLAEPPYGTDGYFYVSTQQQEKAGMIAVIDVCPAKFYLKWKDRYGGTQSQGFDGRTTYKESFNTTNIETYNLISYPINISITPSWEINTKWIDEDVLPFYESIFVSPYLELYDVENDKAYNVIVTDKNFTERTFKNTKKQFNLTLNLQAAKKQNIIY